MIPKPTKGILDLCARLGKEYSVCVIDRENVIYRDLHNGYDFEISGVDNNRKNMKAILYVWEQKRVVVEMIEDINSFEKLQSVLEEVAFKYSQIDSSHH